jgi:hypothetical protein
MNTSGSTKWRLYERTGFLEARPWAPEFDMTMVSVSAADRAAGHPKAGGMIARRNGITDDMWYIAPEFFAENYRQPSEPAGRSETECRYCKRPVNSDGCIYHEGDCAGLQERRISRLRLDWLREHPESVAYEFSETKE